MRAHPAFLGFCRRADVLCRILPAALLAGLWSAGCAAIDARDYIAELALTARTATEAGRTGPLPTRPSPTWTLNGAGPRNQAVALTPPSSSRAMPFPMTYLSINGTRTFALIDTGSNISLIDGRGALRTGVIPLRAEPSGTPGGPPLLLRAEGWGPGTHFNYILAAVDQIEFDNLGLRNGYIGILDQSAVLAPFGWMNSTPAETLIGCDILRSFARVVLDIPGSQIALYAHGSGTDPQSIRVGRSGQTPLLPEFDVLLPVVEVELSNGLRVPVVLDSGSDMGLCLPPTLARRAGVVYDPFRRGMVVFQAVGGESGYWPADPLGVKFGELDLGEVEVGVSILRLHQREPAFGLLGLRALKNFRITLDFANGHVELRR